MHNFFYCGILISKEQVLKAVMRKSSCRLPYRKSKTGTEIFDTDTRQMKNTSELVSEKAGFCFSRHTRFEHTLQCFTEITEGTVNLGGTTVDYRPKTDIYYLSWGVFYFQQQLSRGLAASVAKQLLCELFG